MTTAEYGLSKAARSFNGKRIPLINTALPRANQYFTAWHEIYHLLFDEVSFDHLIESETLMEERKAEYFAALMLLGNLMPYFEGLKDMDFQAKAFQCMNAFQSPYKAVLISLYESAVKNGNTAIAEEVKENFDVQVEDIAHRFRDLGLDDSTGGYLTAGALCRKLGCISSCDGDRGNEHIYGRKSK